MNEKHKASDATLELAHLLGHVIYTGNKMAAELADLLSVARESGCDLQEVELVLKEWDALLNPSQEASQ